MLSNFLTQTCTITEKVITNDNGIEDVGDVIIYENIPCQYYSEGGGLKETSIGINTPNYSGSVLLSGDKISVKREMKIEVKDPSMGVIGNFIIDINPKPNYFINGMIDSIKLVLRNR